MKVKIFFTRHDGTCGMVFVSCVIDIVSVFRSVPAIFCMLPKCICLSLISLLTICVRESECMWKCVFLRFSESESESVSVSVSVQRSNGLLSPSVLLCLTQTCMKLASHAHVCLFSLSHSNVCPPTGQCPNGLSCFPSLSLCKYSGSPSDFIRTRPRSVHACLNANIHTIHT